MNESNTDTTVVVNTPAIEKTIPSKRTFAAQLKSIKDMVGGLTAEAGVLKAKGFTPEFIADMEQLHQDILDVDDQRNFAKSQSITLTKNLTAKMTDIHQRYSQAKIRIKLELPRDEWPKYGFYDVR